ncbi:hypothetical protein FDA94_10420 [Herbidospora galbida]|uniref:Serine peptidase n=1 Tax=Herbidospora galbida TaxID=2575442 RepID=A0A4U3MIY2_9ACTN|nr:hypothetical protein [Herbidospora galbida]TKK89335.1 hypothetical protein FDA94_10420 [Herbidospora galbida]
MTIVGVHGIGKYKYFEQGGGSPVRAADLMLAKWNRYLHEGGLTGASVVEVAYYAHHLRKGAPQPPKKMAPPEKMVFTDWMRQVEDHRVAAAAGETLTALAHRLAGWLLDRLGAGALKFAEDFCPEVATYLGGGAPRTLSRDAVATVIRRRRPRVVIAHSLGSVVTYEAFWAHPDLRADLLVTLGSPLGMRNVVFERLAPLPVAGMGARPPGVGRWINVADKDDIAAIPAELRPVFKGVERDLQCNIDWLDFHTVRNYLGCGVLNSHLRDFLQ